MYEILQLFLKVNWFYVIVATFIWFAKGKLLSKTKPKNYKYLRNLPLRLPGIGHSYYFLGSPEKIFHAIITIFDSLPKGWDGFLGFHRFYGITDPDIIDAIVSHPKSMNKGSMYLKCFSILMGEGLFSAPVLKWRKNRKMISPTFNQKILDTFVRIFQEKSNILVERLKKENVINKEFCVFRHVSEFSLDTVVATTFGIEINAQSGNSEFVYHLDRSFEIMWLKVFRFWYQIDAIFRFFPECKKLKESANYISTLIDGVIKNKRAEYEVRKQNELSGEIGEADLQRRKAFLDLLMEMEGVKLTDKELKEECITNAVAGSDTTSISASFTFLLLGMYPEVQQKAYEEITEILGNDPMDFSVLPKLKYLERVLKESLRLFPPGALIVREIYEPQVFNGYFFDGPASLVLGICHLHRNPLYWRDPLKFDPDRFLPEECAKRHPNAYMPFSSGIRNCIGQKYALMMLKVVVATVVRNFSISTPYKNIEDIKLMVKILLKPKDGFLVRFHPRT